jgi:hypothetical protein
MQSSETTTITGPTAIEALSHLAAWTEQCRQATAAALSRLRAIMASIRTRAHAVTPDQLLWTTVILLLAIYAFVLVTGQSGVARGGR